MASAATSSNHSPLSPRPLQFPSDSPPPSPLPLHTSSPASSSSSLPSIRLWPPNSNTRSTLVHRLRDHLSSVSFFSQRYGQIGPDEALLHAHRIEDAAFLAASSHAQLESSDIAVVQFYAKEASRLTLECLKNGPSATEETSAPPPPPPPAAAPPPVVDTLFDISGGDREFLTEATAQDLLKPLAVPGNSYTSVCLSNRSFGEEAAKVAGKILEAIKSQLIQVNLADIVAGRNEDEALSVMSIFSTALSGCNLKYLNLSDNALGEKGVRAFSDLLQSQDSLEELYFVNNGISEEAAVAICDILPSSSKLRVLHFHNNMTGDSGAIALSGLVKAAPLLEDFRCSSTRIASEGAIALSQALLAGSSLRRLDLRDNPFGIEGAIALAETLKQHPNLRELYLSYLGLEDEGTKVILEAIEEGAPELEVLELAGNDITIDSVLTLARFLATKPNLTRLNLSENELEDRGIVTICNVLGDGHDALVELDLSETKIGRIGACAAAEAISSKAGFKLLNLNSNHISEAGIEALKDALQRGRHVGISLLGSLDENDENEELDEETDESGNGQVDDGLDAQFGNLMKT